MTRGAVRWVAASSVAASLALAAAPAQAAAPATSHLRSGAAPATVLVGAATIVSGAISPSVKGSPVVLQRLVAGHWQTLTHQATGKGGTYAFTVRANGKVGAWSLRVLRAASSRAKAVVGKTLKVRLTKVAYKITSSVVSKVTVGTPVVVTGSVSPRTTGQVTLQVLHLGKWGTLATGRLTNSTYSFSEQLPPKTYPLRVLKTYNATIATGESTPVNVTVFPAVGTVARPPVSPVVSFSSPDDALLGLPGSRLVFSTVHSAAVPSQSFTFSNSGTVPATISGLAIQGTDAPSFSLSAGQPTTLTIPAGGSATVSVDFHPTPATNCPTTASPYNLSQPVRLAALVFSTDDTGLPGGSAVVAGINSCNYSGAEEPVLDQVLTALGYTTVVATPGGERRFLGQTPHLPGTDEIAAPYFKVADPTQPVSLTPLAHYSSADVVPYHAAGWYAQGATLGADDVCNSACNKLWDFAPEATVNTYTQNQKLLPTVVGTQTFSPTGNFGLFTGEFRDVNFTDDSLNIAHSTASGEPDLVPTQYLHDMRVYPAYGPGHVVIPDTYLIAVDVTREPDDKNNDFQDMVLLLRNAVPAS